MGIEQEGSVFPEAMCERRRDQRAGRNRLCRGKTLGMLLQALSAEELLTNWPVAVPARMARTLELGNEIDNGKVWAFLPEYGRRPDRRRLMRARSAIAREYGRPEFVL
jgi:hypothetical protein